MSPVPADRKTGIGNFDDRHRGLIIYLLTSEGSSTAGFIVLPAPVTDVAFGALVRSWLGRATAAEVLKVRVSLETGMESRDDIIGYVMAKQSAD